VPQVVEPQRLKAGRPHRGVEDHRGEAGGAERPTHRHGEHQVAGIMRPVSQVRAEFLA
jgi:hypothetical protein